MNMLIVKAKHGKRKYKYGGRGIFEDTLKNIARPLAQKLAIAAVTGATKGFVQSALRKRSEEPVVKRQKLANQVINGSGIVLD